MQILAKIRDFFVSQSEIPATPITPTPKPWELKLLESQIELASPEHGQWALKWYLQLCLDGLPPATAAKQASFKFFGSHQE